MPRHAEGPRQSRDQREQALAEAHLARTDLQAIVQGEFMEELLGLPRIVSELDRIDALIDSLASNPASEFSDEAISEERASQVDQLVADLELA
jgi:hypothetical protein